ncbi:peroxisomal N(1)-acetyl-spermine/spermidine oxidase-like [Anopheles cruzii]|uniref:peroxisomal N(1)-acetyl-spermine/spermidine oxidase-like n=1 Tax=Anopheles cruzii TaxID=68878 RepID=UPI0022EC6C76|nr:peroxisomal N(1)-acetyl-spermine/spermidine oxidase-like [Anopheles cruzii]
MNSSPAVLIVGAGAAGIAAATRLLEHGFYNLTILEGENRIGGRIHSVRHGNNMLDYGAQWVHGKDNNFIYDMANEYGLVEIEPHKENDLYYRSNGEPVPKHLSDRMMNTLHKLLDANVEALKSFSGSLGEFYDMVFQDALRAGKFAGIDRRTCYQLYDFFIKYENTYNATDTLHEISGAGLLEFEDNQDEYLINWRNRGFHTLLDLLMKKLPEQNGANPIPVEDYIRFNHTVNSIRWNTNLDRESVTIGCANGATFTARHLIVTVSLGVLQEMHHRWFDPPLPLAKRNAIEGLYIGTIGKMFLEFDEPFWPTDGTWHGFGLLWEKDDLDQIASDRRWLTGVCSFFVPAHTERLLVAWVFGDAARTMESLPEADVIHGLMYLLRKFIPPTFGRLPAVPRWFSRTRWHNNPHFRGAYSSRSLKSDLMNAKAADLATPLLTGEGSRALPIVQFAGEASHPELYSTVQGAVGSGWREANRLITAYRTSTLPKKAKL